MFIVGAISIVLLLVAIGYLTYVRTNSDKYTKERYAFSCLTSTLSLANVAIIAVSSKERFTDHLARFIYTVIGADPPLPNPATALEQFLLVLLSVFAIYHIWQSYHSWPGAISVDEYGRRKRREPVTLIQQGSDEVIRLLYRGGPRAVFDKTQSARIAAMMYTPHDEIVWKEHIKQMFSIWNTDVVFSDEDSSWSDVLKCWFCSNRRSGSSVILFCFQEQPTIDEWQNISSEVRVEGVNPGKLYVAVRVGGWSIAAQDGGLDVTILTEDFLFDRIADFSDYKYDIIRRVEKATLPGSLFTIKDIYVESHIEPLERADGPTRLGIFLSDWAKDLPGRQIALLGEYGQGKSTAALMFTYDAVLSNWDVSGGRIPILFELRGKSPANLLPAELLATWAQNYNINPSALLKLAMAGRLILIFEGFDEMANVGDIESRTSQFRALWRFAYPQSKILFTGRRNLFFQEKEIDIIFGDSQNTARGPRCDIVRLRPFDRAQIVEGLRYASEKTQAQILAAVDKSPQMQDIATRPSLLYILAQFWNEISAVTNAESITAAAVIDQFIEQSYKRQTEKGISALGFMSLLEGERRYFHEGLVAFMANGEATTNYISAPDFATAIRLLYEGYPEDRHLIPPTILEPNLRPLKARFSDIDNPIDIVATDVRTHGIVVNDPSRRGAFKFAHKSFFELIQAKLLVAWTTNSQNEPHSTIFSSLNWSNDLGMMTPEVLKFFAEILFQRIGRDEKDSKHQNLSHTVLEVMVTNKQDSYFIRRLKITNARFVIEMTYRPFARAVVFTLIFSACSIILIFSKYIGVGIKQNIFRELLEMGLPTTFAILSAYMASYILTFNLESMRQKNVYLLWVASFVVTNKEEILMQQTYLPKKDLIRMISLANAAFGLSQQVGSKASEQ